MNNEILHCRINRFFANDICFPADEKNLSVEEVWQAYLSGQSITVNDALNILADLPRSVWEKDKDDIKALAECMLVNAEFTWSKYIMNKHMKRISVICQDNGMKIAEGRFYLPEGRITNKVSQALSAARRLWRLRLF